MTTKRFTSREQIIAKIDKFTDKSKKQHKEAVELLEDSRNLTRMSRKSKSGSTPAAMITEAAFKESDAERLIKASKRIQERVLPELKRKLAEFDTQTIPGITDDKTVEGI